MRQGEFGPIIGQFLGTFSVSPGSVPGEGTKDVAVPAPGAVPGDCLIVNLVTDLPNSKLLQNFATCTVAGTVQLRYANMSVGAGDPGTHTVAIWRMGTALNPSASLQGRQGSYGPIVGRFLGTFNVDPPDTPANDSLDLDFAVPTANVDDLVFCSIQEALATNITKPTVVRVPSNGVVRLRYGNPTIGSVNTMPRMVSFFALSKFAGAHPRATDYPLVGLYVGSVSIDFASIAADLTVETAAAPAVVPSGLEDGDIILASATQALDANIMHVNARKPAGLDQVTIALSNLTAGAIDPAANTWRCWAFRSRAIS